MDAGSVEISQIADGPRSAPLLSLKNTVVFPGARSAITLSGNRESALVAIREAQRVDGRILVSGARDAEAAESESAETRPDTHSIGALAQIKKIEPQADDTIQVILFGVERVRIMEWIQETPYPLASYESLPDQESANPALAQALINQARNSFEKYAHLSRRFQTEEIAPVLALTTTGALADALAGLVVSDSAQQQELLEMMDPDVRLERVCVSLVNEVEVLELESKIRQRVRQQVDKNQREYYLREQLRAIHEELGQDQANEARELRDRLAQKGLPAESFVRVGKEIDRLERMPPHSAEVVVLRNYLDWILALPWQERTEDRLDMREAQQVLDEDHFGLEKVKERIVEFLAVRQLRAQQVERQAERQRKDGAELARSDKTTHKGPILCLVGPPGVGKTSLGRSVARALGRKFVRISLGGIHDEAEIRGHRRTYVGALPGRIIQAMKTVGTRNPVFLLDEIDKMASDYRGDPAAALLETLDPEQNNTFTDHYLEIPYDLSEVFFICTGNDRYQIPAALRDRMDVIEIPGYTEEEKIAIGRNFVLPKVLNEHGLTRGQLQVPEDAMRLVITGYTREAGVRGLERQLATISRKAARRVLEQPGTRVRLGAKNLEQYLGAPRYLPDKPVEEGLVGVAVGLAWTANGGAILPVEVVTMPGKGGLMVTGQLGDVMQESSRAALSYIRSRADDLQLTEDFPNNLDIHIHLPEGAIPKDGPSAGITMAIAMISALTRRPVRHDLAMTGEITLRGRVLPIGGLKEKALAAHRVGIRTVLIPAENMKDLADIPEKIRQAMDFIPVETMDRVIELALQSEGASADVGDGLETSRAAEPLPIAAEPVATADESDLEPPPPGHAPQTDSWPSA
jgi:ATP-dependent Lon protease